MESSQATGLSAQELTGEINPDEEGEKPHPPSHSDQKAEAYGQGHRGVHSQEPAPGEPGHPRSPKAEGEIDEQDKPCHFPERRR